MSDWILGDAVDTTALSWILEANPMVMGCDSARTTAPYHTDDSSQFVTFPITDADGAMNVSFVWNGLLPMNIMVGLCLVKICGIEVKESDSFQ